MVGAGDLAAGVAPDGGDPSPGTRTGVVGSDDSAGSPRPRLVPRRTFDEIARLLKRHAVRRDIDGP